MHWKPGKLTGVSEEIILVAALVGAWEIPVSSQARDVQTPAATAGQRNFSGKTFRMLVVGDPFANALKVASDERNDDTP
jgi:hypothetical protein